MAEIPSPHYFKVKYEDGETELVTEPFIHFSREAVAIACDELADYWARKCMEFESEN